MTMNEGDRRFFPEKPKYPSPFFSYQINNAGEVLELSNQALAGMKSGQVEIAPATDGIIGPITIIQEPFVGSHRGLWLTVALNVPPSYTHKFLTVPENRNPSPLDRLLGKAKITESDRRGLEFERDVRQHIDGELKLTYGETLSKVRNGEVLETQKVKIFPWNAPYINYLLERAGGSGDKSVSEAFFQKQLEDFLNIAIIYSTMLYKYYGITDQPRKIVIDPGNFKIIFREMSAGLRLKLMTENPDLNPGLVAARAVITGERVEDTMNEMTIEVHEENTTSRGPNVVDFKPVTKNKIWD